MTIDRHLLAFVSAKPVFATATGSALSSWAFWQAAIERATTVCSFAAALGGLALFIYNLRAAHRRKRIMANLPCVKCGYAGGKP